MKRITIPLAGLIAVLFIGVASAAEGDPAAKEPATIAFNKQVAPIFTRYCTGCHDAKEFNGKLNLSGYKTLLRGGEHGAVVVPGQPEKSRLILVLEKRVEPFMPPFGEKAPTAKEIDLLKAWIKAGAKGPAGTESLLLLPNTPRIKVIGEPRKPIHAVAWSPDGPQYAVARHGAVELYSAEDRKRLSTLDDLIGQVNDVGFSTDGRTLFAAAGAPGLFGEATLFDVAGGKPLRSIRGHSDSLYAAALSPDGTMLATGSYDQKIKLWDAATGEELRTLDGHNGAVFGLAFHPNGRVVASASGDSTVKLWDAATGERLDTRNEPTKGQNTLAFSPNGQWLVAGGVDNRLRVWRMTRQGRARIEYSRFAHEAPILKIAFSPDGKRLVSSAEDRTVKVWETERFTQLAALEEQPDWVAALGVSPDGETLLAGRMDGSLATYRIGQQAGTGETPEPISDGGIAAVSPARSPAGSRLTEAAEVKEVEPNDLPEQATAVTAPVHADGVLDSPDGKAADVDLYRFEANTGRAWIIETSAARPKPHGSQPVGFGADTKIEVLHADGRPVERLLLRAVRDSYITFRPINSTQANVRVKNWEEMQLNQYMYMNGEVCKLFRMPQGPDSGFLFYTVKGQRQCYFDTSATIHPLDEPVYIVEPYRPPEAHGPRPVGLRADNGLPVFPLRYVNDDDAQRKLGTDSKLTFTAPADGVYLVRVSDVRGFGGPEFKYRLTIREPVPDFDVTVAGRDATVGVGSGQRLSFKLDRQDNFNGPVRIDVAGVPDGFHVPSPIVVEAGHLEARGVVSASAELTLPKKDDAGAAKGDWSKVEVTATATIAGREVTKRIGNLGTIKLAPRPKVVVQLNSELPTGEAGTETAAGELVIAPGTTITALLSIERNGFSGELKFDVDNLPHGVIVDNIGLNGILIREGENRRQIFLTAADWVPESTRMIHAVAQGQGNQASPPIALSVRRPAEVAGSTTPK